MRPVRSHQMQAFPSQISFDMLDLDDELYNDDCKFGFLLQTTNAMCLDDNESSGEDFDDQDGEDSGF